MTEKVLVTSPVSLFTQSAKVQQVTLEQAIILIRIGSLRFTGKSKKTLLWEAHVLLNKSVPESPRLFSSPVKSFTLPVFETATIEDAYDEIELLGFPVTISMFDLLRTDFRGDIIARELVNHVGKSVRMVGNYITAKHVRTVRNETMNFGTFLDVEGNFFDTTHFPPSLRAYPFKGAGVYLILGRVVEEFGFPSIEVEKMAKLPVKADPRSG